MKICTRHLNMLKEMIRDDEALVLSDASLVKAIESVVEDVLAGSILASEDGVFDLFIRVERTGHPECPDAEQVDTNQTSNEEIQIGDARTMVNMLGLGVPPGCELDKRLKMACKTSPIKVSYGSYSNGKALYNIYLSAEPVPLEHTTLDPMTEAAIRMIDADRSLGREEIIKRLKTEMEHCGC